MLGLLEIDEHDEWYREFMNLFLGLRDLQDLKSVLSTATVQDNEDLLLKVLSRLYLIICCRNNIILTDL